VPLGAKLAIRVDFYGLKGVDLSRFEKVSNIKGGKAVLIRAKRFFCALY
jgi:hypothetical protein